MEKNNTRSDLAKMIQKYLDGKASAKELEFLESYYGYFEKEEDMLDSLPENEKNLMQDHIEANILRSIKEKKDVKLRNIWPIRFYKPLIAASLLIMLGAGAYLFMKPMSNQIDKKEILTAADKVKATNGNSAILTLANGKQLILDQMQKGPIANDAGVSISKSEDGKLVYTIKDLSSSEHTEKLMYNTITTPNGNEYQVNLPDGTKVWLNAESTLKYPVVFAKDNRSVELDGEAYFEVTNSKNKPFLVNAKNTQVRVLGTHFNINAYKNDEMVKTTLLEGSVAVKKNSIEKILKPGEQSIIYNQSPDIRVKEVDLEEVLAWKRGYFIFNDEDIKTVMKTIARWYNIEVVYESEIKNEIFIGTVSRFDSIEKLLKTIELTGGVHFKIDSKPGNKNERRVTVMP
jgi:transmembrane sensor